MKLSTQSIAKGRYREPTATVFATFTPTTAATAADVVWRGEEEDEEDGEFMNASLPESPSLAAKYAANESQRFRRNRGSIRCASYCSSTAPAKKMIYVARDVQAYHQPIKSLTYGRVDPSLSPTASKVGGPVQRTRSTGAVGLCKTGGVPAHVFPPSRTDTGTHFEAQRPPGVVYRSFQRPSAPRPASSVRLLSRIGGTGSLLLLRQRKLDNFALVEARGEDTRETTNPASQSHRGNRPCVVSSEGTNDSFHPNVSALYSARSRPSDACEFENVPCKSITDGKERSVSGFFVRHAFTVSRGTVPRYKANKSVRRLFGVTSARKPNTRCCEIPTEDVERETRNVHNNRFSSKADASYWCQAESNVAEGLTRGKKTERKTIGARKVRPTPIYFPAEALAACPTQTCRPPRQKAMYTTAIFTEEPDAEQEQPLDERQAEEVELVAADGNTFFVYKVAERQKRALPRYRGNGGGLLSNPVLIEPCHFSEVVKERKNLHSNRCFIADLNKRKVPTRGGVLMFASAPCQPGGPINPQHAAGSSETHDGHREMEYFAEEEDEDDGEEVKDSTVILVPEEDSNVDEREDYPETEQELPEYRINSQEEPLPPRFVLRTISMHPSGVGLTGNAESTPASAHGTSRGAFATGPCHRPTQFSSTCDSSLCSTTYATISAGSYNRSRPTTSGRVRCSGDSTFAYPPTCSPMQRVSRVPSRPNMPIYSKNNEDISSWRTLLTPEDEVIQKHGRRSMSVQGRPHNGGGRPMTVATNMGRSSGASRAALLKHPSKERCPSPCIVVRRHGSDSSTTLFSPERADGASYQDALLTGCTGDIRRSSASSTNSAPMKKRTCRKTQFNMRRAGEGASKPTADTESARQSSSESESSNSSRSRRSSSTDSGFDCSRATPKRSLISSSVARRESTAKGIKSLMTQEGRSSSKFKRSGSWIAITNTLAANTLTSRTWRENHHRSRSDMFSSASRSTEPSRLQRENSAPRFTETNKKGVSDLRDTPNGGDNNCLLAGKGNGCFFSEQQRKEAYLGMIKDKNEAKDSVISVEQKGKGGVKRRHAATAEETYIEGDKDHQLNRTGDVDDEGRRGAGRSTRLPPVTRTSRQVRHPSPFVSCNLNTESTCTEACTSTLCPRSFPTVRSPETSSYCFSRRSYDRDLLAGSSRPTIPAQLHRSRCSERVILVSSNISSRRAPGCSTNGFVLPRSSSRNVVHREGNRYTHNEVYTTHADNRCSTRNSEYHIGNSRFSNAYNNISNSGKIPACQAAVCKEQGQGRLEPALCLSSSMVSPVTSPQASTQEKESSDNCEIEGHTREEKWSTTLRNVAEDYNAGRLEEELTDDTKKSGRGSQADLDVEEEPMLDTSQERTSEEDKTNSVKDDSESGDPRGFVKQRLMSKEKEYEFVEGKVVYGALKSDFASETNTSSGRASGYGAAPRNTVVDDHRVFRRSRRALTTGRSVCTSDSHSSVAIPVCYRGRDRVVLSLRSEASRQNHGCIGTTNSTARVLQQSQRRRGQALRHTGTSGVNSARLTEEEQEPEFRKYKAASLCLACCNFKTATSHRKSERSSSAARETKNTSGTREDAERNYTAARERSLKPSCPSPEHTLPASPDTGEQQKLSLPSAGGEGCPRRMNASAVMETQPERSNAPLRARDAKSVSRSNSLPTTPSPGEYRSRPSPSFCIYPTIKTNTAHVCVPRTARTSSLARQKRLSQTSAFATAEEQRRSSFASECSSPPESFETSSATRSYESSRSALLRSIRGPGASLLCASPLSSQQILSRSTTLYKDAAPGQSHAIAAIEKGDSFFSSQQALEPRCGLVRSLAEARRTLRSAASCDDTHTRGHLSAASDFYANEGSSLQPLLPSFSPPCCDLTTKQQSISHAALPWASRLPGHEDTLFLHSNVEDKRSRPTPSHYLCSYYSNDEAGSEMGATIVALRSSGNTGCARNIPALHTSAASLAVDQPKRQRTEHERYVRGKDASAYTRYNCCPSGLPRQVTLETGAALSVTCSCYPEQSKPPSPSGRNAYPAPLCKAIVGENWCSDAVTDCSMPPYNSTSQQLDDAPYSNVALAGASAPLGRHNRSNRCSVEPAAACWPSCFPRRPTLLATTRGMLGHCGRDLPSHKRAYSLSSGHLQRRPCCSSPGADRGRGGADRGGFEQSAGGHNCRHSLLEKLPGIEGVMAHDFALRTRPAATAYTRCKEKWKYMHNSEGTHQNIMTIDSGPRSTPSSWYKLSTNSLASVARNPDKQESALYGKHFSVPRASCGAGRSMQVCAEKQRDEGCLSSQAAIHQSSHKFHNSSRSAPEKWDVLQAAAATVGKVEAAQEVKSVAAAAVAFATNAHSSRAKQPAKSVASSSNANAMGSANQISSCSVCYSSRNKCLHDVNDDKWRLRSCGSSKTSTASSRRSSTHSSWEATSVDVSISTPSVSSDSSWSSTLSLSWSDSSGGAGSCGRRSADQR